MKYPQPKLAITTTGHKRQTRVLTNVSSTLLIEKYECTYACKLPFVMDKFRKQNQYFLKEKTQALSNSH